MEAATLLAQPLLRIPKPSDGSKDSDTKSPRKGGKALVLIAVPAAATAGIWIPLALRSDYVSPDRP